jgi:L-ornithine Nalpha-acyltransferase
MTRPVAPYSVHIATDAEEVRSAQRLRYRVFAEELGASGPTVHAAEGVEADRFDAASRHLLVIDVLRDEVVGVTRLLDTDGAEKAGGFASEAEFDIGALRRSGRRVLEVGRTCVHPDHRGTDAAQRLWQGVGALVQREGIEILFGLASLRGCDAAETAAGLLHAHPAPEDLRPRSLEPMRLPPACGPIGRGIPALLKGYLRLGGGVGEGAFHDRAFGCIDLCLVVDVARMPSLGRAAFAGSRD